MSFSRASGSGKLSYPQIATSSSSSHQFNPISNPFINTTLKMKTSAILATLFAASTTLAQNGITCNGDIFNSYCCEGGSFSGPVVSSFLGSFSTRDASRSSAFASRDASRSAAQSSREASLSSAEASREASLSSIQASVTSAVSGAVITARAVLHGRAVTTEVQPGLTCIGDAVSSFPGDGAITSDFTTTFGSGGTETATATDSTATGATAGTCLSCGIFLSSANSRKGTTSSSTAGAAFMTQAPALMMGAAAFAYAAM